MMEMGGLLKFCAVAAGLGLAVEGTARALKLWEFDPEKVWDVETPWGHVRLRWDWKAHALLFWGGVYGPLAWSARHLPRGVQRSLSTIPGGLAERLNEETKLWTFSTANGEFLGLPKPWGRVLLTHLWGEVVPAVVRIERIAP